MPIPRSEAGRIAWRTYFDSPDHRRSWSEWHGFGELVECGDGHDRSDGFLCTSCQNKVSLMLSHVPALAFEANLSLLKQTSFVERGDVVRSGQAEEEDPLPFNPAARTALARLGLALGARDGSLVDIALRARSLAADLGPVLRNPGAARWAWKLSQAVRSCQRVIERPADVWYLGPCPGCRADLYAERDAEDVACPCGWHATREEHQHAALDRADDVWLTVGELVGAITQAGETVSRDQINNWIKREGLVREKRSRPIWRNGKLLPRTVYVYRLGDVRALAQRAERKRSA